MIKTYTTMIIKNNIQGSNLKIAILRNFTVQFLFYTYMHTHMHMHKYSINLNYSLKYKKNFNNLIHIRILKYQGS